MILKNILQIAELPGGDSEIFETLCKGQHIHVERIISNGQTTPENKWYDAQKNEWVVLIQGKARLEMEGGNTIELSAGDYLLIPAGQKHRVAYTSDSPHCIWLAIHFD